MMKHEDFLAGLCIGLTCFLLFALCDAALLGGFFVLCLLRSH